MEPKAQVESLLGDEEAAVKKRRQAVEDLDERLRQRGEKIKTAEEKIAPLQGEFVKRPRCSNPSR